MSETLLKVAPLDKPLKEITHCEECGATLVLHWMFKNVRCCPECTLPPTWYISREESTMEDNERK